jgi:hypothetical protein
MVMVSAMGNGGEWALAVKAVAHRRHSNARGKGRVFIADTIF